MKRTLKRIAPLQLGIVFGIFYALFSLIIIPFLALGMIASELTPHHGESAQNAFSMVAALSMMVILPIVYGVLGFIFGALGALLYNLIASWVGGIEVEVE